ncbi:DUF6303 family protein [Streptomyces sp. SP18CS02]|uniref:DUF6303 family protein n=1 Tax=Streptomyces sp. SP18CS02 TaxID=3002531 RepID=UPI002E778E61|nr:DUF6303 family protein [Streptomyces sp. SP18CS02]MEE1755628.1 DUF6303 family protein [Streptomyces sp. SP18CS02]
MSGATFRAQISDGGGWHLYVALPNTSRMWPEWEWPRGIPTPTLAERDEALAALGYEVVPGAEWDWCEDSDGPGSPVRLLAAVAVRRAGGAT